MVDLQLKLHDKTFRRVFFYNFSLFFIINEFIFFGYETLCLGSIGKTVMSKYFLTGWMIAVVVDL